MTQQSPAPSGWQTPGDANTLPLPLRHATPDTVSVGLATGSRALEDTAFPFEELSEIAEAESWRKQINWPLYHIHKWWAQRLGTVFRAMVIGAFAPSGADTLDLFYKPVRIGGATVFDPFMGSGTTIGEALKLGVRAVGRDINPVAHFLVRNALAVHDRAAILFTYSAIERDVAGKIRRYYQSTLPDGGQVDVLYYFWVKTVNCPACDLAVDLFSSYIFARHAYPQKFPQAQALCPACGAINEVLRDARETRCGACGTGYDPQAGPANRQKASCPACAHAFPIAATVRKSGCPPDHRMYAKLVLMPDGSKAYIPATDQDRAL